MLQRRARVDLGAMAMKGRSIFPKPQHYWDLTIRLFSVIYRIFLLGGGSYPSAEVQSVYTTAPADWAILCLNLDGKGIVSYLLPKCFQSYFWSSSGVMYGCIYIYIYIYAQNVKEKLPKFKTVTCLVQVIVGRW